MVEKGASTYYPDFTRRSAPHLSFFFTKASIFLKGRVNAGGQTLVSQKQHSVTKSEHANHRRRYNIRHVRVIAVVLISRAAIARTR
jgi:hypothetical protein